MLTIGKKRDGGTGFFMTHGGLRVGTSIPTGVRIRLSNLPSRFGYGDTAEAVVVCVRGKQMLCFIGRPDEHVFFGAIGTGVSVAVIEAPLRKRLSLLAQQLTVWVRSTYAW